MLNTLCDFIIFIIFMLNNSLLQPFDYFDTRKTLSATSRFIS